MIPAFAAAGENISTAAAGKKNDCFNIRNSVCLDLP